MIKQVLNGIKIVFQDRGSLWIAVFSSLAIGYLYYWLLTRVTTIPQFFAMAQNGDFGRHSMAYAATYWITTVAAIVLFGISVSVAVWLWRRYRLNATTSGSSSVGAVLGAAGAACPVCGAFLLQAIGVSAGVAALPLQGLEFQFASLGLILGSTLLAARKVSKGVECGECKDLPTHQSSHTTGRMRGFALRKAERAETRASARGALHQ